MRIVFMGTPEFAVPTLSELIGQGHEIVAVYTQPPRRAGRGQDLRPSAIDAFARRNGLEVRVPKSFRTVEEQDAFRALTSDAAVVVAYGLILPKAVLATPRLGCLNVHASLLPRWRGAAPIQRAIMAGDTETGISIMQMDEGLDTGDVLMMERVPIGPRATSGEIHDVLSALGASMMIRALPALERGAIKPQPQDTEGITYADKIEKSESRINWALPARQLDCIIRGLTPFPGAWFEMPGVNGECVRVRVLAARTVEGRAQAGSIFSTNPLCIACGEGALELVTLQRAGGRAMSAEDYLRGAPVPPGTLLS